MPNSVVKSKPDYSINQDNHLWLQFWRDQRVDFHQTVVNPLLAKFWFSLDLVYGSRVFVPMCGKSLDMIWLVKQGHQVVGVELSPVAVMAFFRENGLKPVQRQLGEFTLWQSGKLSILCGDYFALTKAQLGFFDIVYDRSALTALPENIRGFYVEQLRKIIPDKAKVFLLTIEDAAEHETLEQAVDIGNEIEKLYSKDFWIDLAYVESVFEPALESSEPSSRRAEHKVYRLLSKSKNPQVDR